MTTETCACLCHYAPGIVHEGEHCCAAPAMLDVPEVTTEVEITDGLDWVEDETV